MVTAAVKDKLQITTASMPGNARRTFYLIARPWSPHNWTGPAPQPAGRGRRWSSWCCFSCLGICGPGSSSRRHPASSYCDAGCPVQAGRPGNPRAWGTDFGLMVDGGVIIIENAVRRLGRRRRQTGKPPSPHRALAGRRRSHHEGTRPRSLAKPSSPSHLPIPGAVGN